jgi:hypothetical protein
MGGFHRKSTCYYPKVKHRSPLLFLVTDLVLYLRQEINLISCSLLSFRTAFRDYYPCEEGKDTDGRSGIPKRIPLCLLRDHQKWFLFLVFGGHAVSFHLLMGRPVTQVVHTARFGDLGGLRLYTYSSHYWNSREFRRVRLEVLQIVPKKRGLLLKERQLFFIGRQPIFFAS